MGPGLWPADLEGHKHSDPLLQLARSLLCRPWDITPQVTNRRSTVIRHFHSTTHSPARCTLCYLDWSKYALTFTPHFYNPHFRFYDPHSTTPSPTFYHPLTPHSWKLWPLLITIFADLIVGSCLLVSFRCSSVYVSCHRCDGFAWHDIQIILHNMQTFRVIHKLYR